MLKSIGRSSHSWLENLWRHCLPAAPHPQDHFVATAGAAATRAVGWQGHHAQRCIDIPHSQTIVSYNCLNCNTPVFPHRTHDMASDHTRTAILSAAERLYADRGFGDVTLRDIVAAADVNLAAVNYHFGSKDELIAELFVTRSLATNRERLNELKSAEEAGGGRASIESILRALVGPTLRGCLGPDRERSTAARFMIRASIESVPPIRRIKNREIDHLRKFAAAMRRALPDRDEVELYWGVHFALAMAHETIRDSERLTKLSEGLCDLDDVEGIIERIVAVSVRALTAGAPAKAPEPVAVRRAR